MSYKYVPEPVETSDSEQPLTLPHEISAVQIQSESESETRLSPVFKLPRGARVKPCGRGFNSNTLKVCYEGQFYFVFARQLAAAS